MALDLSKSDIQKPQPQSHQTDTEFKRSFNMFANLAISSMYAFIDHIPGKKLLLLSHEVDMPQG